MGLRLPLPWLRGILPCWLKLKLWPPKSLLLGVGSYEEAVVAVATSCVTQLAGAVVKDRA